MDRPTDTNPVVSLEQARRDRDRKRKRKSTDLTKRVEELERATDLMHLELFDLKRDFKQLTEEFNRLLRLLRDRLPP